MNEDIAIPFSRALVTGGAGFIGSHLAETRCGEGCRVAGLDNFTTGSRENLSGIDGGLEVVEGDIRDLPLLESAAEGCEVIFHEAAVVSVPQTVEDPVLKSLQPDHWAACHLLEERQGVTS